VDEQADVYSLGATLYHALAGHPPFLGAGVGEVIQRVMMEDPEPLPDSVPDACSPPRSRRTASAATRAPRTSAPTSAA
jgi:serine/threonine protein kinase